MKRKILLVEVEKMTFCEGQFCNERDTCLRFLKEDPWERLRILRKKLPNTRLQMLLRGQNIVGYRHYADDVLEAFIERAASNGIDVFRIFDALNDPRNMETAIKATIEHDGHAQGTISYTTSPVLDLQTWVDLSLRLQDSGCHSLAIKDMAGLLDPFVGFELVSRLKEEIQHQSWELNQVVHE